MIVMKDGDEFDDQSIYLGYFQAKTLTAQLYIFSVREPSTFYSANILNVDVLNYISISHKYAYHMSGMVYYNFSLNFKGVEVWKLTEDEALDILSEVI